MIQNLNKDFESRVRLGIMSILMVNDNVSFLRMKELLEVTDGNLASHTATLEKNNYIKVKKVFQAKKPKTSYSITSQGRKAFQDHLDALSKLLE